MATITRPAPLSSHKWLGTKKKQVAKSADAGGTTPAPSVYDRSALPLALAWFALPAGLLLLSAAFGWGR